MIANTIKKLRVDKGYTQLQVANMLKIDRSTYSYYETGRIYPDVKTILNLAEIFGVKYTELLEPETSNNYSVANRTNTERLDDKKAIEVFDKLTDEERDLVLKFRMVSLQSQQEISDFAQNCFKKEKQHSTKDEVLKMLKK